MATGMTGPRGRETVECLREFLRVLITDKKKTLAIRTFIVSQKHLNTK